MCGIAGFIDWNKNINDQLNILYEMRDSLSHRGPDDKGIYVNNHVGLAHHRLIVVDPAGGGQPMTRIVGDRSYTIVYNGELYNTEHLRKELTLSGYQFTSNSDTEVLLISYIEWGTACVKKFNGIYAFAIWDNTRQSLFMARDRLGVKPLFYSVKGNTFIFGSEIKALLKHPSVKPEIDRYGLAEIFVLGPMRTPGYGVFRNIKELKPGHSLIYNKNGINIEKYWSLQNEVHKDDIDTTAEKIRWLLKDTVERQLVADVPVCTLLSGGVDSSCITYFAAKAYEERGIGQLNTYSVDYADNGEFFKPNEFQPNSDGPWIKVMSSYLNTKHHNVVLDTPKLADALYDALVARDLPGMADIDSSLYLFCKKIKKGATVALSGECADEIFGGYPWFKNIDLNKKGTFPWIRMINERAKLLKPELREILRPEEYISYRYAEAIKEVPHFDDEDPYEHKIKDLLYINMTHFMAMLLDRKDRMSMAVGLEVRVPFADHRLVQYVWNIPWSMKSCDNIEKGILRRALKGLLPEAVLNRRKSPYPKTHNPTYLNAVKKLLIDALKSPDSRLHQLIDIEQLNKVIETDASNFSPAWFSQLMGGAQLFAYLYQIDLWLKKYNVDIFI